VVVGVFVQLLYMVWGFNKIAAFLPDLTDHRNIDSHELFLANL
jgi:hypothetical protein